MVVKVIGETTILNFQTMLFSQESETKICISAAPSHRVSDRPPATQRQKLLKGGLPNRPSNKQTADQRFFGVPENGILCFMYKSNPPWNKLMPTCWSWIAFRLFRFLYLVDLMSLQIMETWFEMISTVSAFASIGKQSQRGVPCNSASLASHQEDWYTVCGLQSTHEMPGDCGDCYEISQTLTHWLRELRCIFRTCLGLQVPSAPSLGWMEDCANKALEKVTGDIRWHICRAFWLLSGKCPNRRSKSSDIEICTKQ